MDEHRFSRITRDDHAGSLWIATLLCLVYSVMTLALRAYLRWNMYGVDDYLALVATGLHIGEAVAIMVGLDYGLGKAQELLRSNDMILESRATFTSLILFVIAATAAKGSTVCLMMRLFNLSGTKAQNQSLARVQHRICVAILALIGLWGVLSIVAIAVDCSLPGLFQPDQSQCSRQVRLHCKPYSI